MGLREADRAEIWSGKSYGVGEHFQLKAGIPGATQEPGAAYPTTLKHL
jgi:hypothetical protein